MTTICPWCERPFTPTVRGGHVKKFCSASCKRAAETAARAYGFAMVERGLATMDDLKHASASRATAESRDKETA